MIGLGGLVALRPNYKEICTNDQLRFIVIQLSDVISLRKTIKNQTSRQS